MVAILLEAKTYGVGKEWLIQLCMLLLHDTSVQRQIQVIALRAHTHTPLWISNYTLEVF